MVQENTCKLVDLGEAISNPNQQLFEIQDLRFAELIMEMYLFYDEPLTRFVDKLLRLKNIKYYFSPCFIKHLEIVLNGDTGILSIEKLINELEDEEKIAAIRLELKK